jgi:hypothetical protein
LDYKAENCLNEGVFGLELSLNNLGLGFKVGLFLLLEDVPLDSFNNRVELAVAVFHFFVSGVPSTGSVAMAMHPTKDSVSLFFALLTFPSLSFTAHRILVLPSLLLSGLIILTSQVWW